VDQTGNSRYIAETSNTLDETHTFFFRTNFLSGGTTKHIDWRNLCLFNSFGRSPLGCSAGGKAWRSFVRKKCGKSFFFAKFAHPWYSVLQPQNILVYSPSLAKLPRSIRSAMLHSLGRYAPSVVTHRYAPSVVEVGKGFSFLPWFSYFPYISATGEKFSDLFSHSWCPVILRSTHVTFFKIRRGGSEIFTCEF